MNNSKRFTRLAQLLFTSVVSDEEKQYAKKAVDAFIKLSAEFGHWLDTIENNLNVLAHYKEQHGDEKALVVAAEKFADIQEKQKENYERIINDLKRAIEYTDNFKDIEMQEIAVNLTRASEEFTKVYNELIDLPQKIGEDAFLDSFISGSQKLLAGKEGLVDMLERVRVYIQKNVLDEQSLS